jgi:galactoside 2-L-fucosyltransferase 1/2
MQWYREKFAEKLIFLIVSDEPEWCRENLLDNDDVVMATKSPEHDFALLAMSNHTIIDYGSFGFWGAVLSSLRGGHTITNQVFSRNTVDLQIMRLERNNWHEAILEKDPVY